MARASDVRIGTAGWSIPRASAPRFDSAGTHLQRYSRWLRCAEINSSFYRPHAASTYAKWRDSTPPDFLFAVKMPRTITHELKLHDSREPLLAFLAQTDGLAQKRGPILVQLPPSLPFDASVVTQFLQLVRNVYAGPIVCEPRHATWFSSSVTSLLDRYRVSRVAADPSPVPAEVVPAGWPGVAYFRLHGSPRKYWSKYDDKYIAALAETVRNIPSAEGIWCVFDNTASGAALENAWELRARVTGSSEPATSLSCDALRRDRSTSIEIAASRIDEEGLMPSKSQAQRRTFAQLLVEGKISNETFEEWSRVTGRKKLPERVGTKAKASRRAKSRRRKPAAKKR
jgi:uncharacterized protein YecE (DUF72 family)